MKTAVILSGLVALASAVPTGSTATTSQITSGSNTVVFAPRETKQGGGWHIGCNADDDCSYYLSANPIHARSQSEVPITSTLWRGHTSSSLKLTPTTWVATRGSTSTSTSTSTSKPSDKSASTSEYATERTGLPSCNFVKEECTDCNSFPEFCLRCCWSRDTFASSFEFEKREECKTYTLQGIVVLCKEIRLDPPKKLHYLHGPNGTELSHGPVVIPHDSNSEKPN